MSDNWCTIESDPGVFTELIREIGVKNVAVEEVYSLEDEDLIESLKPIYGLVFLFKWKKSPEKRQCLEYYDEDLFFANQVIQNACATQAILSCLLNCDQIDIGQELENFKTFTKQFDSRTRGQVLSNSDVIRRVHNSFARPEPFDVLQDKKPSKGGDAFHFISYLPFKGKLYELDGLQEGPILLGDIENKNWLDMAKEEINRRTANYEGDEIRFNLLALCANKHDMALQDNKKHTALLAHLYKKLKSLNQNIDAAAHPEAEELLKNVDNYVVDEAAVPQTAEAVNDSIKNIKNEVGRNKLIIEDEGKKFQRYEAENKRRKHNYIPFIVEMLKLTAKKGHLKTLVDEATTKREARLKQKQEAKNKAA